MAWKPQLWPGLRRLWPGQTSGQAKATTHSLAPARLGPGCSFPMYFLCKGILYFYYRLCIRNMVSETYSEQYMSSSSSSSIESPSQDGSSSSNSSSAGSLWSLPVLSSSWSSKSLSFASIFDDGAGSLKSKSCQIAHLIHCRASTMSPLRQLQHFDIVIPPCENALSLDTDDDKIAR